MSHHPAVEAREKGRDSCLVIRENHGRRAGTLQKKCLMAGESERPCFGTRGVKEAIWQVCLFAPFSFVRLAPSPDVPLMHFASPGGETCRPTPFFLRPGRFPNH